MHNQILLPDYSLVILCDMSCYVIAQIRIPDDQEHQKYINKAGTIFRKYREGYSSVDNAPLQLEGDGEDGRMVLIRFETKKHSKNCIIQ